MSKQKTDSQPLPKWFDGFVLKSNETIANRFTGEKIELNPNEVAMYDTIMGAEFLASRYNDPFSKEAQKFYDIVRKGCSWFRRYNARAYMVLLD